MTDFIIICHGRTEVILSKWLKEQTRASINVDSKNSGKNAIMLNNLVDFMKRNGYYSISRLKRRFPEIEYRHRAGVKDLLIFTVMDVDVDKKLVNSYLTKKMFDGCPLYDNIFPIINERSLDEVMERIGFWINSYNKLEDYRQVLNRITLKDLYQKVKCRDDTNLGLMLEKILEHCCEYQNKTWLSK